jgi:hypothetical protein
MSKRLLLSHLVSVFVVSSALLGGCTKPTDPPPEVKVECTTTAECKNGNVCRDNRCVACERDRECARDEFCHPIQRKCQLQQCFGRDCQLNDECSLGSFCVQGLCLPSGGAGSCKVTTCSDDTGCGEGQRCDPVNLVCEKDLGCFVDADCGPGLGCNTTTGECVATCTPDNSAEVCGITRICKDGRCADCTANEDCAVGQTCNLSTNTCESPNSCKVNRDCKVPLVCNRVTNSCTEDPGKCFSKDDCRLDETCQIQTGKCVPLECQPDRFVPNNTLETAKAISVGVTSELTVCSSSTVSDVDYFKIPLRSGDRIDVFVVIDTLLKFDIAVLDPTGAVMIESDFSTWTVAPVDGDYFIRAQSADYYVRYGLRISVTRGTPCDPDENEPNNTYDAAKLVSQGDLFGQSICAGDLDWFLVAANRGQTVEVTLNTTPEDGEIDIALFDTAGLKKLAESANAVPTQVVSTNAFAGNGVYVKVFGNGPIQNKYDLSVRVR